MNFEKPIISAMTDEEIQNTINACYEEQQRRRRAQRASIINEFHEAFTKLREAGILPRYDDPNCMEASYLERWSNFTFE